MLGLGVRSLRQSPKTARRPSQSANLCRRCSGQQAGNLYFFTTLEGSVGLLCFYFYTLVSTRWPEKKCTRKTFHLSGDCYHLKQGKKDNEIKQCPARRICEDCLKKSWSCSICGKIHVLRVGIDNNQATWQVAYAHFLSSGQISEIVHQLCC